MEVNDYIMCIVKLTFQFPCVIFFIKSRPVLQFSFFILVFLYSLHSLYTILDILLVSSPLTFFLLLDLTLFFYDHSNTSDDITTNVIFDNVL